MNFLITEKYYMRRLLQPVLITTFIYTPQAAKKQMLSSFQKRGKALKVLY
jgi:hypothetical protein